MELSSRIINGRFKIKEQFNCNMDFVNVENNAVDRSRDDGHTGEIQPLAFVISLFMDRSYSQ